MTVERPCTGRMLMSDLILDSVRFSYHLFLQIKTYNPTLERKVREEVMKLLDQKENEFLPQVSLSVNEVRVVIYYLTATLKKLKFN